MITAAPAAPPSPPRRSRLVGAIGACLVVALVAAGFAQTRLAQLLNLTTLYQDDYLQVNLGQLESEYLRLMAAWRDAIAAPQVPRETLQLRYDVFLSRVDLLGQPSARRLALDRGDFERTRKRIYAFIAQADALLGPNAGQPLDGAGLARLLPELAALDGPIHDYPLDAGHHVATQTAERTIAIRQYNRTAIALTIALCVTTLVFALITMRQMHVIEQRRRSLEDLAASLRSARVAAEAASQAKSAFLANMSHEIRTPFQGLLGMLSLLDGTAPGPRQSGYVRTASESAQHLLAILNDILDLSKLESGSLQIAGRPVALRPLLDEVEALMRPQATSRGLAFEIECAAGLPERLIGDPTRLKQILFNLLSNAIKFTDQGRVSVQVRRAQGGWIAFTVQDSGIGIDAQTMARLFERFTQGDASPSRRHGGSGLGLEISRNLARLMGGDIDVESAPGEGSRFTLRLPCTEASPDAPPPDEAAVAPARGLRVLVAEDHPVNRIVLNAVLERLGHAPHLVETGADALACVRDDPGIDLVLMDLHMPVLDGIEAARRIRALGGAAARVPIIAVTADAFQETQTRCFEAGFDGFVAKPVDPDVLKSTIDRVIAARGTPMPADPAERFSTSQAQTSTGSISSRMPNRP